MNNPSPTAPDSPEITLWSFPKGEDNTLIPLAAIESSHDTEKSALSLKIFQLIVLGSPQASPAIIVVKSPVTL